MTYERLSPPAKRVAIAPFLLVYITFFLDNVLLTVLVPIIPDWVRGEALALWAGAAPLARMLNASVQRAVDEADSHGVGASQLVVGAVLGAKSGVQLACAPPAAALTARLGPARALRLATVLLAAAALGLGWCGRRGGRGGAGCAGAARGAQGAGAALAGVAGLALVSRASPARLAALLGAVALGVLVGYPFGGAAYKMWSDAAPFQVIAIVFLLNFGMQCAFLNNPEYNESSEANARSSWREVWREASGADGSGCTQGVECAGGAGAGAGALLVTTAALAALEPCLPLWLHQTFHPQRWALGAIFIPDSVGYLVATSVVPLLCGRVAAESVAVGGVLAVAVGAMLLPSARSLATLALCQVAVGGGVGAADAALVPALLARAPLSRVPHRAALLQAAASAALALGPVVGGVAAYMAGFAVALRALGAANLLTALLLYRALSADPISERWSAAAAVCGEHTPLEPASPRLP